MQLNLKNYDDVVTFLPLSYLWSLLVSTISRGKVEPSNSIFSLRYKKWFKSWSEYWFESGEREALIAITTANFKRPISYSWKSPLISKLINDFPSTPVVVLHDWDMSKVGTLEVRFPNIKRAQFYDDYIAIPFSDVISARKFADNIPISLSDYFILHDGVEISVRSESSNR